MTRFWHIPASQVIVGDKVNVVGRGTRRVRSAIRDGHLIIFWFDDDDTAYTAFDNAQIATFLTHPDLMQRASAGIDRAEARRDRAEEIPERLYQALHQKLDEAVAMYLNGAPLRILTSVTFASTTHQDFTVDIVVKESP